MTPCKNLSKYILVWMLLISIGLHGDVDIQGEDWGVLKRTLGDLSFLSVCSPEKDCWCSLEKDCRLSFLACCSKEDYSAWRGWVVGVARRFEQNK